MLNTQVSLNALNDKQTNMSECLLAVIRLYILLKPGAHQSPDLRDFMGNLHKSRSVVSY
jgi:hypothetical protein